jgi:hypothetical protein
VQHRPIRFFIIRLQRWMEKTTGPSAMARLGNPVAHLSGWCRCGSGRGSIKVIKINAYSNSSKGANSLNLIAYEGIFQNIFAFSLCKRTHSTFYA